MSPNPSSLTTSPRHQNVFQPKESEIPQILAAAWAVCTPADTPLVDQLNTKEKTFLILFSEYISTALSSPLSTSDPATVLSDILMTARHRLSLLSKEVSLSPHHVVIVTLLQLLANLFSADNMKYASVDDFLAVYPGFRERCSLEQDKLFHTANWMHILFKITTAKKNKGMVMEIIPKFVEGNHIQYVTGSGQTQPTKDRVTVYETEGNVKPIKRLQRKSKKEVMEMVRQGEGSGSSRGAKGKAAYKKATYVKRKTLSSGSSGSSTRGRKRAVEVAEVDSAKSGVRLSHSPSATHVPQYSSYDYEDTNDIEDIGVVTEEEASQEQKQQQSSNPYLPLQTSFAMAPPMPVRRSQSSFSQAAAAIANFDQTVLQSRGGGDGDGVNGAAKPDIYTDALGGVSLASSPSYVCSPRECYLDVESNGTMRKTTSANWGLSHSLSSSSFGALSCLSPRGCSSSLSNHPDYQLQMLREVSEDSDFSMEGKDLGAEALGSASSSSGHLLPPYLVQQQSLTLTLPTTAAVSTSALGSPNPQPRTLERCTTSSLDDEGEVDLELLDVLSRQASYSWLSRSASNSSLSGGGSSSLSINAA